ncbi:MAG: nucleoside triphosphate pyrophosphohydrolase [Acidobacteriota bacterium]
MAATKAFGRLVRIMATLRSANGCPWDVKQDHASLRPYLIEEAYEAVDAIDRGDIGALPGELGDVLLQCVFHAQIASETGTFTITDVVNAICEKLVRRHPHVFTAAGRRLSPAARTRAGVASAQAVADQWGQLKAREQAGSGAPARTLAGLPTALPALLRAARIGARVAAVGFDWPQTMDVLDKVDEEVRELREAVGESHERAVDEFGDLLFSLASLARHLKIDPETALRHANDKFTRRFTALEADFDARGQQLQGATLAELEAAWSRVKQQDSPSSSSTSDRTMSSRGSRARPSRR